jgi:hypothetical protein
MLVVIVVLGGYLLWHWWLPKNPKVPYSPGRLGQVREVEWWWGYYQPKYLGVYESQGGTWLWVVGRDKEGKPHIMKIFMQGTYQGVAVDPVELRMGNNNAVKSSQAADYRKALRFGQPIQIVYPADVPSVPTEQGVMDQYCRERNVPRLCQIEKLTELIGTASLKQFKETGWSPDLVLPAIELNTEVYAD